MQHLVAIAVTKVDIVKHHIAFHMGQFDGVWRILNVRPFIQQFKDAFSRGNGLLESIVHLRQPPKWVIERSNVSQEGNQGT